MYLKLVKHLHGQRILDPEVILLMLNSAEHENLNAHKNKNIKTFSVFQAQRSLECNFSCSEML